MGDAGPPQYYENTLIPLPINSETLVESFRELRDAVYIGSELVHVNETLPEKWSVGGMFKHFPGVALAFLRLDYQSSVLANAGKPSPDYRGFALQRIPSGFPDCPLRPSRLSPAGSFSPIAAATLHILSKVAQANWQSDSKPSLAQEDIDFLFDAANLALQNEHLVPHDDRKMGGDEMLYGRAGLLWVLLNIRTHEFDEGTRKALSPVLDTIPRLVDVIIDAGRQGAKEYIQEHGETDAHPLMYPWMEGRYCFGAAHGITGILTILLSSKPEELERHLSIIGSTITALCKLSNATNGHLPMALPPMSFGQTSEFVQLCHGSPGILILLSAALKNGPLTRDHWCPDWDQTIYLATQRIWEEGILSKGGSLCHGISGNAWPWLMLHDAFDYHSSDINEARSTYIQRTGISSLPPDFSEKLTPDFFLSKALAFMLHSRETRPYNTASTNSDKEYRMPDDPYSLYEGLAGNICAWAETCAVLQAKLRKIELSAKGVPYEDDSVFQQAMNSQLGFPLIGGNGAVGIL
ncbi:hypothetical protein N7481_010975 [Penicillium waksmanii]|uniref:uncharacterized protein n=1 Tax=Penicillium waksmanii TaxID=69791 RepID=UPI002547254F|nr:uncharacterized protein N7481_010975 [Penicillium waksmanii]KAJ5973765.1 hypothetical protein N7481_010975 [Penicillium waksmanii]